MSNRVLIVDVSHIAYLMAHAKVQLTANVGGSVVNTTIQNGIIKNIYRWSEGGDIPTLVAFDRGCPIRKAWAQEYLGVEYKEGRTANYAIRNALEHTYQLLHNAGVPALAIDGYEADDIVAAAVSSAKILYPDRFIDVVTGDSDLVPLVDDQVSVFLRSNKGTSAVHPEARKERYVQVTPSTYSDIMEGKSVFKGLYIPYNMVLLAKLLRGDPSDKLVSPVKSIFKPKVFNGLVVQLQEAGITSLRFDDDSFHKVLSFLQSNMYITSAQSDQLVYLWCQMYLNFSYPSVGIEPARPSIGNFQFQGYNAQRLQEQCSTLSIRLPLIK